MSVDDDGNEDIDVDDINEMNKEVLVFKGFESNIMMLPGVRQGGASVSTIESR